MRNLIVPILTVAVLSGCGGNSTIKPVEFLDERTAITVGVLREPIELVPSTPASAAARLMGKHISFAYIGPVEWDRAGEIEYGLWLHLAPGTGQAPIDIRAPETITLIMDSGPLVLVPIDAPQLGRGAYQPVASWGETGYFALSVPNLKLMADSQKLTLEVHSGETTLSYFSTEDTKTALSDFIKARQITPD
jgi:hypothetical protein